MKKSPQESKLEIGIIYFIWICVLVFNFIFWTTIYGIGFPIRFLSWIYHLIFTKPLCVNVYYAQGGHKYFANKYHVLIWMEYWESYCDNLKIFRKNS